MATSANDEKQAPAVTATGTEQQTCERCKQVPRGCALRRGMCRACYLRAWRGTELPADASCCACSEQRRVVLRWTQLGDQRLVTCQNCGFLADKTRPRVSTREELIARLERERRRNDRRRNYVVEPEDPAERRTAMRRSRRLASATA